jgi:hypothetical protein
VLGYDPFVITECLVRPVLTQRLLTELNNQDRVNLTKVAWLKEPSQSWGARGKTQAPVTGVSQCFIGGIVSNNATRNTGAAFFS